MNRRKHFRHCLLFVFIPCCIANLFAQEEASRSNTSVQQTKPKSILTDVFVLDLQQPNAFSLTRVGDDTEVQEKEISPRKMEIRHRRPSAFQIQGINPLRYKYYINNESVTHFMDASSQAVVLSGLAGGIVSPSDINVPEIFKAEIKKSDKRDHLITIEREIRDYKDSIIKYEDKIQELWTHYDYQYRTYDEETNTIQDVPADTVQKFLMERSDYDQEISSFSRKLDRLLEDYDRQMVSLPIRGSLPSFLAGYRELGDDQLSRYSNIKKIESDIRSFAQYYHELGEDFIRIETILANPSRLDAMIPSRNISFEPSDDSTQEREELVSLLRKYDYVLADNPFSTNFGSINSGYYPYDFSRRSYSTKIKEFLINKRYQVFEKFIFETATKIGLLLQYKFKELSQLNNTLYQASFISDSQLADVKCKKRELEETFEFVQQINAEFEVLVSYLDIDNSIYTQLAEGINSNYRNLLGYLKTLAFVSETNTVEYTLPSTTNLRNIDLVRYQIDQEDKLTGIRQPLHTYDFWVRGGVKIDFSAGIFASGLIDHNFQHHIYYRGEEITDSLQINRQLAGNYDFAFGGMVNVAPRLGANWLTPGISFGAIYSTNQKLQFLATGSLHIGKTERIILHYGIAMGSVRSIDVSQHHMKTVKKGDTYLVKADSEEFTIPTLDRFRVRPVFGLTYNLSGKNALQGAVNTKGGATSN